MKPPRVRPAVLHLISGLDTGGAELMLLRLLQAFPRRDHAVLSLLTPGPIGRRLQAEGVPVHSLGMAHGRAAIRDLGRLRRLVSDLEPSLIHGWMYHGCLAASIAAGQRPVIWGIHHSVAGLQFERWRTRGLVRLLATLSRFPSAVVYCSVVGARKHEGLGFSRARTRILPNGFDCATFRPDPAARRSARSELGLGDEEFVVGHVARFHPIKDHESFLVAAGELSRLHPVSRFLLIGSDVEHTNPVLAGWVAREGLDGRAWLLGERSDVARILNALDVLVCSSRAEAFPTVLGEAMACGVPCVTTACGDSQRMVGRTGRVVPLGDPKALATGCAELLNMGREARQELGRSARRRIVQRFEIGRIAADYQRLYKQLGGAA